MAVLYRLKPFFSKSEHNYGLARVNEEKDKNDDKNIQQVLTWYDEQQFHLNELQVLKKLWDAKMLKHNKKNENIDWEKIKNVDDLFKVLKLKQTLLGEIIFRYNVFLIHYNLFKQNVKNILTNEIKNYILQRYNHYDINYEINNVLSKNKNDYIKNNIIEDLKDKNIYLKIPEFSNIITKKSLLVITLLAPTNKDYLLKKSQEQHYIKYHNDIIKLYDLIQPKPNKK